MVANTTDLYTIEFRAMASPCQVLLPAASEAAARELAQHAIDEVRRIETKYSRYRADSVVSAINGAAGGEAVALDDETAALLHYAAQLYELSGGLFDITTGVLRKAWDFSAARLPAPGQLDALLALTGWTKVQRERRSVRLPVAGMELDFGGFGKEYAADRAAACLLDAGVRHGYVNLGGDFHVLGPRPDGSPWRIAIQDPRRADATIAAIDVAGGALCTSGDYERYFELDGRRYCHILDPATGLPVTAWRSVSVLAPLTAAAGACATIAMLKGARAPAFLEGMQVGYLAVGADGKVHSKDNKAIQISGSAS
ncbi:FAD:protein FMN transferase [Pseudoduganella namucuonensis]|uniref:FAD:protein FMN transferase n=1 Tax=Pseudoduganella namucuonensis TaxID=1035707 RepID=A0A1I7I4F2_9BURK|nr:FAD:protein FMN transferase [Pseudoduganella namucuonensis]SFU67784.1 thiamine biosynthesis lipoprotein [Pseudoduganella namucuonensis]